MPRKNDKDFSSQIFELIELAIRYVNQEVRAMVEKNVVAPIKSAGIALARSIITAVILAMAAIFITVGFLLLFIRLVGSAWLAFLLIGIVLLISAFIPYIFKKNR